MALRRMTRDISVGVGGYFDHIMGFLPRFITSEFTLDYAVAILLHSRKSMANGDDLAAESTLSVKERSSHHSTQQEVNSQFGDSYFFRIRNHEVT